MYNEHEVLWVEKYRPRTMDDVILPPSLRGVFHGHVIDGVVPNLILSGPPGIGKTTVARALLEDLGFEYYLLNSSKERGIDVLRNDITSFASTVSMNGKRKYVILDEADYLPPLTQAALRNFIEECSSNCGFIFTCNFKGKIIDAIHSRCSVIDFAADSSRDEMVSLFLKRLVSVIFRGEGVKKYDLKHLAQFTIAMFPDFRRVLNEIQSCTNAGTVDSTRLLSAQSHQLSDLISYMKARDFSKARKWIGENVSRVPSDVFYRSIYDTCHEFVSPPDIPLLVLIIAKYQYQDSFVASKEINTAACVAAIMGEISLK